TNNNPYYPNYGGQDEFARLDRNDDGVISRREWDGTRSEFDRLDVNHDGVLSRRELSGQADDTIGTSGEIISVDPTEQWNDTGIWVEAGDMITFDAQGTIQMSDNGNDVATPAGARSGRTA